MRNFLNFMRTGLLLILLVSIVSAVHAQPLLTDYTKTGFHQKVDVPVVIPVSLDQTPVVIPADVTVYSMRPDAATVSSDVTKLYLLNQRTELERLRYYTEIQRLTEQRSRSRYHSYTEPTRSSSRLALY